MDKTAIKNFAIEARKILMKSAITEAGFYGVTKDGSKSPVQKGSDFEVYETLAGTENRIFGDDIKRRANLVRAVEKQGFEQVIEETAYTWFNRIIAIRFMEVNNYLPTRVRVLSSEAGGGTPDIVTQADTVELNLTSEELDKIRDAKKNNRYDDAFRLLFIKQCNELNTILPGLFEKTDDYMELLLKISYTSDGVIRMLIDSIPESNFNVETEGQVEIIGWMYQYYNTELKDDTFAKLKKNVKITKERIPAATQLFTPDWIVRYMVENSLGRVWIEHLRALNPSVDEKAEAEEFGWQYYLPEAEQEEDVQTQLIEIRKSYKDLTPQDITCIDPCMGSGHILVYMFDVLMDIYRSEGFSEREAVFEILEKNIHGLDIDRRAYQLSYFALMMKARGYNRIFFRGHEDVDGNRIMVEPKVYSIEESNTIARDQLKYYGADLDEMRKNNAINQMNGLLDALYDAKEYGSILIVDNYDWNLLREFVEKTDDYGQISLISFAAGQSQRLLNKLIDIGETLSKQYYTAITNPPYMGSGGMGAKLSDFIKINYTESRSDLFSVFIEKCACLTKKDGLYAMITMHSWMFLQSFSALRNRIIEHQTIINLLHLGSHAFAQGDVGTIVQTTSYILRKQKVNKYIANYLRLVDYTTPEEKQIAVLNHKNIYSVSQDKFNGIPGEPIAYWLSDNALETFVKYGKLGDYCEVTRGMTTGNNELYLRVWYEVPFNKISLTSKTIEESKSSRKKWFPHNKGGDYRTWYGNNDLVVEFENGGESLRRYYEVNKAVRFTGSEFYFHSGITWTALAGTNSFRFSECHTFDSNKGPMLFADKERVNYILGFLNSRISQFYVRVLNPTLSLQNADMNNLPYNEDPNIKSEINKLVQECINTSKVDWDSFETSYDFKMNPIVELALSKKKNENSTLFISDLFLEWEQKCAERYETIKNNEKRINELFINSYGLQSDVEYEFIPRLITVRQADPKRDIRHFISYIVGCMMGRYSLNEQGIVFAGGVFDESKYKEFSADQDAIIPITDEQYFEDDIVNRLVKFVKLVFGEASLENNLDYIAKSLDIKGTSSRDKIRNYFINEFFKDHCNMYSVDGAGRHPIYWLFDSGKMNGFKCLVYLHRYKPETVGLIRSDYLTQTQGMIENALKNADYTIKSSTSAVDRAQATKKRDKYIKQLAEIRAYYPALSHIALQRIELDLDDGVKANYEKFQGIEVSVEGEKKQKIDLLAKI